MYHQFTVNNITVYNTMRCISVWWDYHVCIMLCMRVLGVLLKYRVAVLL